MLNLAVNQRAQYLDTDGKPLSLGRVTYYDVGTTTPKSVYADPNALIELTNPLELDIGGFVPVSGVFYGEGNYTVLVEKCVNPDSPIGERIYDEEWVMPNVPGTIISDVTSSSTTFINAVEDIPSLNPGEYSFVYCQQYYNDLNRDSGGGWFRWFPASTATPDLGSIFSTTGSPAIGRYIRIYHDNKVKTSYYGVVGGKNASMVSRIQSAATYAFSNQMELEFSTGYIQCSGDFTINAGKVIIEDGFRIVRLESLVATSLLINCTDIDVQCRGKFITESGEPFGPTNLTIESATPFNVRPDWWGADKTGTQDSWSGFSNAAISANLSASPVVIDGTFVLQATGAFTQPEATVNQLVFTKNSWIQTTFPKVIIGEIEKSPSDFNVVRIPDSGSEVYLGSVNGAVSASWLFPTTMTSTLFYKVLSDLQDGLKPVSVYWDSPRSQGWTINGTMTNDSVAQLTYHYFTPGNFVSLSQAGAGVASFGRIRTLTGCLSTTHYAPKMYQGDTFNALWWGLNSASSGATVATALGKSLYAATNSSLGTKGTLDLNGLTLNCGVIGDVDLDNGNLIILNGSLSAVGQVCKILNADYLELKGVNAPIEADNCLVLKVKDCVLEFNAHSPLLSGNKVAISDSTINTGGELIIESSVDIQLLDSSLTAQNYIKCVLSTGSSVDNCIFTILNTKLTEYYRHVEFKNVSECSITNNKFIAGPAIGTSEPTQNFGFIWITGNDSSSVVRGFSMFGNQMIDKTNPQAAIPGYLYTWLVDLAWITQNDLAIDGHVADVYDNYGNAYTLADSDGNLPSAQIIPGTRCHVPRLYSGSENTFYFILPRDIVNLGGAPGTQYVSVCRLFSGPNSSTSSPFVPARLQQPVTLNPPFTSKLLNSNPTFEINAEVWVNTGIGNQRYTFGS